MSARDSLRTKSKAWTALYRFAAVLGLAIGVSSISAPDASAQSATCRQLQASLDTLGTTSGRSQYEKYDRAIREQRRELGIIKQRARATGCSFALGRGSAQCQAIGVKIERMESNLADLQRTRADLAGARDTRRERARLTAALAENRCNDQAQTRTVLNSNEGGLFQRLNRRGSFEYLGPIEDFDPSDDGSSSGISVEDTSVKAYRTMCVRTCDGYYFPMSPQSSRDDFSRDQQNCESICPGSEVRTYYQRAGEDNVDAMMSAATGEPYSDLSTAYLYRQQNAPVCGCGQVATQQNFSIIAGTGSAAQEMKETLAPVIPNPWPRPDPAADPETLANALGGLNADQLKQILTQKKPTTPLPPEERKVRVVGPTFLPDQSTAASQPVQVPKPGP